MHGAFHGRISAPLWTQARRDSGPIIYDLVSRLELPLLLQESIGGKDPGMEDHQGPPQVWEWSLKLVTVRGVLSRAPGLGEDLLEAEVSRTEVISSTDFQ